MEAIWEAGGLVFYDYQFDESGNLEPETEPPAPAWLRGLVGDDFLSHAVMVSCLTSELSIEAVLEHLNRLTNLTRLYLLTTQVSDVGLENIKGLARLESLELSGTQVTDVGLHHLRGLTGLKYLGLKHTHVTDEGIEELRKALPNCDISWDGETAQAPTDSNRDQP